MKWPSIKMKFHQITVFCCVKISILHYTEFKVHEYGPTQTHTQTHLAQRRKKWKEERVLNARMSLITLEFSQYSLCVSLGVCCEPYPYVYTVYWHMCPTRFCVMYANILCHLVFLSLVECESVTTQLIIKHGIKFRFILLTILSPSHCSFVSPPPRRSLPLSIPTVCILEIAQSLNRNFIYRKLGQANLSLQSFLHIAKYWSLHTNKHSGISTSLKSQRVQKFCNHFPFLIIILRWAINRANPKSVE